jgi:hypothetical protein
MDKEGAAMIEKFNPEALAERTDEAGAPSFEVRKGVQAVDEDMIRLHVIDTAQLHPAAIRYFAQWANGEWFDFVSNEHDWTNGQVLEAMLREWCGGRTVPA